MSDPVMPSLEDLVEAGARALYEDEPAHAHQPWEDVPGVIKGNGRVAVRAILAAVLPRVLGAMSESLAVFADVANDYDELEEDDLQVLVDFDYLAPRLRLGIFRRARTVRDQIAKLMEAGDG